MDPLDLAGKVLDDTKVVPTKGGVGIFFGQRAVAAWVLAVTLGGFAFACGGILYAREIRHQFTELHAEVSAIREGLAEWVSWQKSADVTIRYNTARGDLIDSEHRDQAADRLLPHQHLPLRQRPPDCHDVEKGVPCILK